MTYRVTIKDSSGKQVRVSDCAMWTGVHEVLDREHNQVHFQGCTLEIEALGRRITPKLDIETGEAVEPIT